MLSFPHWQSGLVLSCGVTGAIIWLSIYWMKNKKSSNGDRQNSRLTAASDLLNPQWSKVGKVTDLYCYPLKSGRGKKITQCKFTEFGISFTNDAQLPLRDRMFLAYKEENGKFITGRDYPKMVLIHVYAVDKLTMRLEVAGIPSLDFELPQDSKGKTIDCAMWFDELTKCIDCGDAPAEWISMFGLFADIASYMLMSESSLNELNKKLKKSVTALQFRPNIVVSGTDPFVEDKWEWIKIGENVVIRNVRPCPRCTMVRIDPETGTIDDEPLKVLRTFREQNDADKVSVDGKAPILGIYCGLYSAGNVAVDDVFVHMP